MTNPHDEQGPLMRAKWELARVTALALQDAGLTAEDVAGEAGEDSKTLQRWLDGLVNDVFLDRLAALHAVVAERTGQWPLAWLIGGKPSEAEPSDDDLRQMLKDHGGDKALDVDAMPIADVRDLLAQMRLLPETAGDRPYADADVSLIEELAEINASRKLSNSLERAERANRRHGTRVVASPDVIRGQPRIDGTRMPVAMLIIYLRSMTESEISREWSHLPPNWLDAIIAWIDAQRVGDGE